MKYFIKSSLIVFLTIFFPTSIYGNDFDKNWIFINKTGNIVSIPYSNEYDSIRIIANNIFAVKKDNQWGLVDEAGNMIVKPQYDDIKSGLLGDNLAVMIKKDNQWGLIDITGKIVVKPQYNDIYIYPGSLAFIKKDNQWGLINLTGKIIVEPKYDYIQYDFRSNNYSIAKKNKWGLINKDGELIFEPQFNNIKPIFPNDLLFFLESNRWGLMDFNGKTIVKPKYEEIGNFSEGLIAVKSGLWGFIDSSGKEITKQNYLEYKDFSEGLAAIKINNKWGFINNTGKLIIKPQFNYAYSFSDGLAVVEIKDKWGFIDKTGEIIIKSMFDAPNDNHRYLLFHIWNMRKSSYLFSEELAAVNINDKWGFIDKTGKIVIEPQFDKVNSFSEGLAAVNINDKWGFIDKTGKIVIEPKYRNVHNFSKNKAYVENYLTISTDQKPDIHINNTDGKSYEVKYNYNHCPSNISDLINDKLFEFFYYDDNNDLKNININLNVRNIGLTGNTNIKVTSLNKIHEDIFRFEQDYDYILNIKLDITKGRFLGGNDLNLPVAIFFGDDKKIVLNIQGFSINSIHSIKINVDPKLK